MNMLPPFPGILLDLPKKSPEQLEKEKVEMATLRAHRARAEHDLMIKNPPSKQALKHFFTERAGIFLTTHEATRVGTRKERRLAARELGKKFAGQVKSQKDEETAEALVESENAKLRLARRGPNMVF